MKLFFTVSGLRGIVGDSLTPDVILRYCVSYLAYSGRGTYFVGMDTRPSGYSIKGFIKEIIKLSGSKVIDVGIAPTPSVVYLVKKYRANGGIVVTASHNPMEWNALKFIHSEGRFPFKEELEEIIKRDKVEWGKWDQIGNEEFSEEIKFDHPRDALKLSYVNVDEIKRRELKVAIDCVNGAASPMMPEVLKEVAKGVVKIHTTPSGIFERNPEPRVENLGELDALLKEGEVDIGFAYDPDGDRLAVGFKGIGMLSEEYTLPLALHHILSFKKGTVVINLSTSMLVEYIASKHGVNVLRTPVGEANVVKGILENKAVAGGEGNGGFILPEFNLTRDGILATLVIMSLAATEKIEEIIDEFPRFEMVKAKIPVEEKFETKRLLDVFKDASIDTRDGVYIRYEDAWLHVRPSNTEPILRLYAEATHRKRALELINKARKTLTG